MMMARLEQPDAFELSEEMHTRMSELWKVRGSCAPSLCCPPGGDCNVKQNSDPQPERESI